MAWSGPSMLRLLYVYAFWPLLVVAVVLAIVRGGGSARAVCAICVAGSVTTKLIEPRLPLRFQTFEHGVMLVDLCVLAAFTAVALIGNRWWLRWVAALQLVSTLGHFARATNPLFLAGGYALMVSASAYPILILLIFALSRPKGEAVVTITLPGCFLPGRSMTPAPRQQL